MIEPGKLNGYLVAIKEELRKAEGKHPDFCDKMIDNEGNFYWNYAEEALKNRNARNGNIYADDVFLEEVAEAFNAYQQGDKKHAMQELAQCGAVILRIMAKVDEEIQKENNENGNQG